MKKLYKVPLRDVSDKTFVFVDDNGTATHDSTYLGWPVLCLGCKVPFKESEILDTLEISDEEYNFIQEIINKRLNKKTNV